MELREMVHVLELCGAALRGAHLVHTGESWPTAERSAVIEMLTGRCRGLTAVGLEAEGNINPPPDLPTGVGGWERSDLTKLAVGCPDIQDLRFPVDIIIKRWRFDKDSQEVGTSLCLGIRASAEFPSTHIYTVASHYLSHTPPYNFS